MNSFKSNICWLLVLLIASFASLSLLLWTISCPTKITEIIKEILIGIVSAILLLLLMEIRNWVRDKKIYGYLNGEYERTGIYKSNLTTTSGTKYSALDYNGIDPRIKFHYKGNRQYQFESQHKEGRIKAVIFLHETNPSEGNGVYQYLTKTEGDFSTDIGHYKLVVDTVNGKHLYMYYRNLLPSGLAEGYETWKKL